MVVYFGKMFIMFGICDYLGSRNQRNVKYQNLITEESLRGIVLGRVKCKENLTVD